MKYLQFEIRKMLKERKNQALILIFFMSIIFGFFYYSFQVKENKEDYLQDLKNIYFNLYTTQQQLYYTTELSENPDLTKAYSQAMDYLNQHYISVVKGDYLDAAQDHMNYLKELESIETLGGEIPELDEEIAVMITKDVYFIEHEIEPVADYYGTGGIYYLQLVFEILFSYAGAIFIILLFFDLYTKEVEERTERLLSVLPIKKIVVQKSKFILSLLATIILLVSASIISFLVGTIFTGTTGSLRYPVVLNIAGDGYEVLPLYLYLIIGGVLFIGISTVILWVIYLLSKISKSSDFTLYFGVGIVTLPSLLLENLFSINETLFFIPFYYVNIGARVKESFQNGSLPLFIIIGLGLFVLILFVFWNIFFSNRWEIRNEI